MSVQSEITRIEAAKTAIKTAIAGKGVTVPDGTMLSGLASLIEGIEAGGLDGASVDEFTTAQKYGDGDPALSFITSIVDSNAFVNLFVDKGLVTTGDSVSVYEFVSCVYFPQFVSEKWKATRYKSSSYGSNAGSNMPCIESGRTLYRITFNEGG